MDVDVDVDVIVISEAVIVIDLILFMLERFSPAHPSVANIKKNNLAVEIVGKT